MSSGTFSAVWTTQAKTTFAKMLAGIVPGPTTPMAYFKVGLGGRYANGEVRAPDPDLLDLDIISNPSRYPQYPDPPYDIPDYGSAALTPLSGGTGSVSVPVAGTVRATCVLDGATYNSASTTLAAPPLICEVAVFDSDDVMVGYGTFGGVLKVAGKTVTLTLDFVL